VATTDLGTILWWAFYGAIRYVLYWVPLVTPFSVDISPPWQWFRYNDWYDWFHRNDNNGGPDEHWLNSWFEMVIGEFKLLVLEEAKPYVDVIRILVLSLLGGIRAGFVSMGHWVGWLNDAIGDHVPWWSGTIARGLDILRDKLPSAIREGWQDWTQLFDGIRNGIESWVRSRYENARAVAFDAWAWVLDIGRGLREWVDSARGWIDAFKADPAGHVRGWLGSAWTWLVGFYQNGRAVVLGWLGPEWPSLVTFARYALGFYFNLWASGWQTLADIVDDPRAWVSDILERALEDRW